MQRALNTLVARHEILRTTFVRHPGLRVPLQVVRDELHPVWETVDLTALPAAQQGERIAQLAARELRAPMDFADGSPLRAVLIASDDARQTLILTLSSLSADAASAALLVAELGHHLIGAGRLTEEPLQYADFAAWQRAAGERRPRGRRGPAVLAGARRRAPKQPRAPVCPIRSGRADRRRVRARRARRTARRHAVERSR